MSNNNQPNTQESSNISPVFNFSPSSFTSMPPPPAAAVYQSYMQAAALYAFHQQQQQQFFQHMFSVPPPPLPTSNIPNRPPTTIRPSLPSNNTQRRTTGKIFEDFLLDNYSFVIDIRQLSNSNSDYQDRKRNFNPSSSFRDNNKKRSYHPDPTSRNDQYRESPVSKRCRTNNNNKNNIIEDEYHEYNKSFS
jgi:hypothetical protein